MTPTGTDGARLVVVDMQRVFADPASPWWTPRFDEAADRIRLLLPAFRGRTVFTRFVAPERPAGAWAAYYERWPFAQTPTDDPMWDVAGGLGSAGTPVVTAAAFGKWGQELAAATGDAHTLVLAGVSTDCCILSTALAAADAGVRVLVVADACAAPVDADHDRAIAAMALYAPLIDITTTDGVLAG